MKKRSGFTLLFSYFLVTYSLAQQLSNEAEISVITCGPGQEAVFTAFGHSAFRVYDPENGINAAFNYGVFDFDQPNFYLNFARGHNRYRLAVQDFERFEYVYQYYNRYVHEQVLNLTLEQKQKLFDYLIWNAKPENQFYFYDYFYDNCATKLPEIVQKVFGEEVVFDGSYIIKPLSIRALTDLYLKYQPWGDLGIDLCLGLPMDKIATPYEHMFLPDYVEYGFDHASLNGESLVKQKVIRYEARPETFSNGIFQPVYVFSLFALLALALTIYDSKRKKISNWFDALFFGLIGLVGLLLFLLWVATDHRAAANNLNVLWALPTHLVVAILVFKPREWVKKYFLIVVIINAVLLISWAWLPQMLHFSLVPIVIALTVRAYIQFRR
ncbi:MAG: DUF4105 domain-containing protein [Cyclobacteriaceae bacterium]|nr:DUF4105 domain-containing protein [Cyclobacteriaceae bacterium]